ncbi:MAG: hypothetical protein KC609_22885 [Myxococcales bacterium]|nr:hypothetical protein [Myxococcales bacterium]
MQTQSPRWHQLLAFVFLALLSACSATTKPTVCHDGGSRRSTYGLDYCEYEFGRFGVSESTFACPAPFDVVYAFANIRLCFLSEADRDLWLESEGRRVDPPVEDVERSDGDGDDLTISPDLTTDLEPSDL